MQSTVRSTHVKHESNVRGVASKSKDTTQECTLVSISLQACGFFKTAGLTLLQEKIKKLLEQLEDVLVMAANDMGDVEVLSSPNLKHDKWAIMQDSQETFKQYLEGRSPTFNSESLLYFTQSHPFLKSPGTVPEAARLGAGQPLKGRSQLKKALHPPGLETCPPKGSISSLAQRPAKRQRSRTVSGPRASLPVTVPVRQPRERRSSRPSVNPAPLLQIEVQDKEQLEKWFREAFLLMQQVACRLVAKVWIKKIHPKKVGQSLPTRSQCLPLTENSSNLHTLTMEECRATSHRIQTGLDLHIGQLVSITHSITPETATFRS